MIVSICAESPQSLRIEFPYHGAVVDAMRSLPQRRWDPGAKAWFVPNGRSYIQGLVEALWKTGLFTHGGSAEAAAGSAPGLREAYRRALRSRHYSARTEKSYLHWFDRYLRFLTSLDGDRDVGDLGRSFAPAGPNACRWS